MNNLINTSFHLKNEIPNHVIVYPILKYLEKILGFQNMTSIIEPLGIPITYLLNKKKYTSYSYFILFLGKILTETKDQDLFTKIYSDESNFTLFHEFNETNYPANLFFKKKTNSSSLFIQYFINKIFGKIFAFELIEKSNRYKITIKLSHDNNINDNFNKFLKSFLSSVFIFAGIKKIHISYYSANNHIIYKIKNREITILKLNEIFLNGILFILIISFNLKYFNYKYFIASMFISIIYFIYKIYSFKNIHSIKKYDKIKNNLYLEIINDVQNKINMQLEKDKELEERNIYLSVLNKVRKSINNSLFFDPILFEVNLSLINDFKFIKGLYYNYNFEQDKFNTAFEFSSDDTLQEYFSTTNFNDLKINLSDYINIIKKTEYPLNVQEFNGKINVLKAENIDTYKNKNLYIYILNLEISQEYLGFYLLFTNQIIFSKKIITELFDSLQDQLDLAYEKISSRYIIENILSSIPAYVVMFDKDTSEIKYVNNKFLSSYPDIKKGLTKEDIINTNLFSTLLSENNKEMIRKNIDNISSKHKTERFEITIENNVYEYNLFYFSSQNKKDKIIGIVINDITEAKYFQKHLLNNEKLLALGKVASGIAHEINNPLYAILSNAEEIAEIDGLHEEIKTYAEEIVNHVENISNIIKDLSLYSKTLRKEEYDDININNVIEESLKLVKYSSNYLEIDVIKELNEIPKIKALKGEMQQIFINLFNNAIQAMDGKGILKITTNNLNGHIIISISDTGNGIPEKDKDHIFELFFTTKSVEKGSGIGLHIVKKIVDKYNGEINFSSDETKGTTFILQFKA